MNFRSKIYFRIILSLIWPIDIALLVLSDPWNLLGTDSPGNSSSIELGRNALNLTFAPTLQEAIHNSHSTGLYIGERQLSMRFQTLYMYMYVLEFYTLSQAWISSWEVRLVFVFSWVIRRRLTQVFQARWQCVVFGTQREINPSLYLRCQVRVHEIAALREQFPFASDAP